MTTLKSLAAVFIFALGLVTAGAEPVTQYSLCPACHGKRSLSLTPPNLGQYDGEIGVMPGRPFTSHRFDVKYKVCPLCEGRGRFESYRLTVKAPAEPGNLAPCPDCRWACVQACRKCKGACFIPCEKCGRSSSYGNKGGKPGWIVEQKATSNGMRSSMKHAKTLVTPCGTCSGIGRVVCPECQGKGGAICRRCKGEGGLPKREKR